MTDKLTAQSHLKFAELDLSRSKVNATSFCRSVNKINSASGNYMELEHLLGFVYVNRKAEPEVAPIFDILENHIKSLIAKAD